MHPNAPFRKRLGGNGRTNGAEGKNLDDALLKAHGIVRDNTPQDKELAPIKCPRCGTVNGATGKFWYKCGAAPDLVTAVNVDKERASLTMELMDLIRQEPSLLVLISF